MFKLHVQPHELLAEGDGKAEQFDRQHSCLVPKRQKEAATQGASNLPPAFVTDVH